MPSESPTKPSHRRTPVSSARALPDSVFCRNDDGRVSPWAALATAVAVVVLAAGWLHLRAPPAAPPAVPPAVPPQTIEKLAIALPGVPHAALLHIAAERGYFAAEGLDVTMLPASHGKAAMELLRQGKADLAVAAEVVFLLSAMQGEAFGIAASVLNVSGDNAVVARRDRAIAAPRDLAGKKIGVSFGTSGDYFLWAFLVRNRLAPEAVTLVDLPPGRIAAALAEGRVDAIVTWAPIVAEAQVALGKNAATFTDTSIYTLNFLLGGRSEFLRAHPQAMEKLLRALLKAEDFSRAQPDEALGLVAKRLKVDADVLGPAWKDFKSRLELRQSLLVTLEDQARWAMARGQAERGPLPNLLPHIYFDALQAVRPERVGVVH